MPRVGSDSPAFFGCLPTEPGKFSSRLVLYSLPFSLNISGLLFFESDCNSFFAFPLINFQDRDMTASNPPQAGSPAFLEGLALESLVDLSSIPSAETSRTGEEERKRFMATQGLRRNALEETMT